MFSIFCLLLATCNHELELLCCTEDVRLSSAVGCPLGCHMTLHVAPHMAPILPFFSSCNYNVKVFALAHAWSQRGVSCFLLTSGKLTPHKTKHVSHCKDDFGNVVHKVINHPDICHFLYKHLPLIDEHNKHSPF
jgi:hypothetical protein